MKIIRGLFCVFLMHFGNVYAGRFAEDLIADHLVQMYSRGLINKERFEAKMLFHSFAPKSVVLFKVQNDFDLLEKFYKIQEEGKGLKEGLNPVFYALNSGKNVFLIPKLAEHLEKSIKENFSSHKKMHLFSEGVPEDATEEEVVDFFASEFDRFSESTTSLLKMKNGVLKAKAQQDLLMILKHIQPLQSSLCSLEHDTNGKLNDWVTFYFDRCTEFMTQSQMNGLEDRLMKRFTFATTFIFQKLSGIQDFLDGSESLTEKELSQSLANLSFAQLSKSEDLVIFDFINDCGNMPDVPTEDIISAFKRLTSGEIKKASGIKQDQGINSQMVFSSLMLGGLVPMEFLKKSRLILSAKEQIEIGDLAYAKLAAVEQTFIASTEENIRRIEAQIIIAEQAISVFENSGKEREDQSLKFENYVTRAFLTILQKEKAFLELKNQLKKESALFLEEYRLYQRNRHRLDREQRYWFLEPFLFQSLRSISDWPYTVTVLAAVKEETDSLKNIITRHFFVTNTLLNKEVMSHYPVWWDRIKYAFQMTALEKNYQEIVQKVMGCLLKKEQEAKNLKDEAEKISYLEKVFLPEIQPLYELSMQKKDDRAVISELLRILKVKTESLIIIHKKI